MHDMRSMLVFMDGGATSMLREFLAWPLLIFNSSVLRASLIKVNVLSSTAVIICELKHQQLWGALMVNFALRAFMTKVSFGDPLLKTMRQHHSTWKPLWCFSRADTTLKQHVLVAFVAAILLDNWEERSISLNLDLRNIKFKKVIHIFKTYSYRDNG